MGYGALDLGDGVDGRDPGEACYLKGEECGDQRPRAHFGCTEFVLGQHQNYKCGITWVVLYASPLLKWLSTDARVQNQA